tara:strand:- start:624 stop:1013 length:390 start_codon:yes stop_codon:yes gene_type:complete
MAYKKQKSLSSYTHEEMEKAFHNDCYEILGPKLNEQARIEAQAAGEAEPNPKRRNAAYNMVFAKLIFKEVGCSWREWKLDQLGEKPREEVKKPVRKMVPLNVKPTQEQMINMVTPRGIKPKAGRPRIEF